jgi:uncharacterized protein YfaS (alpha-2-macroglobulin family)
MNNFSPAAFFSQALSLRCFNNLSIFFTRFIFLIFASFLFSSCSFFSGDKSDEVEYIPAYNSFEGDILTVYPLDFVKNPENISDEQKEKIKNLYSERNDVFEGDVFLNNELVYSMALNSVGVLENYIPEAERTEKNVFAEIRKDQSYAVEWKNGMITMMFDRDVLGEDDMVKIVPKNLILIEAGVKEIVFRYETIKSTAFTEISPEISADDENIILSFPYAIEEPKLNRMKNLFTVFEESALENVNTVLEEKLQEKKKKKNLYESGEYAGKSSSEAQRRRDMREIELDIKEIEKLSFYEQNFFRTEISGEKKTVEYDIKNEIITITIPRKNISGDTKNLILSRLHSNSNEKNNNEDRFYEIKNNIYNNNTLIDIADVQEKSIQISEYFNKSQNYYSSLEIHFEKPLFTDVGETNSDQWIENRKQQKENFLENVSIVPKVDINEESVYLTPQKAVVQIMLQPQTSYSIIDKNSQQELEIETKNFQFEGIEISENQSVFTVNKALQINLYSFPVSNNVKKLLICSLTPEEYELIEEAKDWRFTDFYAEKFLLLVEQFTAEKNKCVRQEIKFDKTMKTEEVTKSLITLSENNDQTHAGMYWVTLDISAEEQKALKTIQEKIESSKNAKNSPENIEESIASLNGYQNRYDKNYSFSDFSNELQRTQEDFILFSLIDSHIVYKKDDRGNDFFSVSSLNQKNSGEKVEGVEIFLIDSSYQEGGNIRKYELISLGKTNEDGTLEYKKESKNTHTWNYGSEVFRYIALKDGKFTSLVSSGWNSGMAPWNFGMTGQPQNNAAKKAVLAHITPDRKLYEPGETIFAKAVIRENAKHLTIPEQSEEYILELRDPKYEIIETERVSPNAFGSVFFEYQIPPSAKRGSYSLNLLREEKVLAQENEETEDEEEITTGEKEFIARMKVEVQDFILPTFEINTHLSEISGENSGENLKESVKNPENKLESTAYEKKEEAEETPENFEYSALKNKIKADISLKYFAGGSMKRGEFSYKIYKKEHYNDDYWDYCYWGCYASERKNYIKSGKGEIIDGSASFTFEQTPEYENYYTDQYEYIVEVTVTDPAGERITGSGTIIVEKYQKNGEVPEEQIDFRVSAPKNIFEAGQEISLEIQGSKEWKDAFNDQKRLFIVRREYASRYFKDISGEMRTTSQFEDFVEQKVSLNSQNFSFDDKGKASFLFTPEKTGEYRIFVKGYETNNPSNAETQKIWIYPENPENSDQVMNMPVIDDLKINIIQEKTEYALGETAKILIQSPFEKSTALITFEKNEIFKTQNIDLQNNVGLLEFEVSEEFFPNAYISIIVQSESGEEYRIGYAEIIVNQNEKKLDITITPEKETYKPRETVKINLSTASLKGEKIPAELSVAVIDESLISMIGNINMDILKSFYNKIPFSVQTAMTSVALKKNIYFSRRGVIGGSGNKGGSSDIFTRSLFKKTAFYKGGVETDQNGNASVSFELPDTIGQFRVVVLGNSKNNFFGGAEKTFSVHQEVVIEEQFPIIFRSGDEITLEANIFNNSEQDENFSVRFFSDELEILENSHEQEIQVNAGERKLMQFAVKVRDSQNETVDYSIEVVSKNNAQKGDSIQKSVALATSPLLETLRKENFSLSSANGNEYDLYFPNYTIAPNRKLSYLHISLGNLPQLGIENVLSSLARYPHGCLEQTTSTTLPNAILLSFADILPIEGFDDAQKAEVEKNVQAGIARIFSMQNADGGFVYWEGDRESSTHYSPYAIWGLAKMKELGQKIDEKKLKKAENYLIENFKNYSPENSDDYKRAEMVESLRALAVLKSEYFLKAVKIITPEKENFSDHEKIMYALALLEYDTEKYRDASKWLLSGIDLDEKKYNYNRYYYSQETDKALIAQAWQYIDAKSDASKASIEALKQYNLNSYFYSTATKNQSFLAFLQHLQGYQKINEKREGSLSFAGDVIGFELSSENTYKSFRVSFDEILSKKNDNYFDDYSISLGMVADSEGESEIFVSVTEHFVPENKEEISSSQNVLHISREIFEIEETPDQPEKIDYSNLSTAEANRAREDARRERDAGEKWKLIKGKNIGLRMGRTYKMRIAVWMDTENTQNLRDIALENYLPSGVKVLNAAFKNDQSTSDESGWDSWWQYKEIKKDMVFASQSYFYSDQKRPKYLEFTFVPTQAGEFIMPPALVYAMYQPTIKANTEYQKIFVERE